MSVNWSPLTDELRIWRTGGLQLPLWWRDDDAIEATPALDRLTRLAEDLALPVHVAVIPKLAKADLAAFIAEHDATIALVHGWQHVSHAPVGEKNAEFGHPRPDALAEATAALKQMKLLFPDRLLEIFVPPWNRLDATLLPGLAQAGYLGVSTYLPRHSRLAAPGLVQINTHIDPIFWRGGRGLVPPDDIIAGLVSVLEDRRSGITDQTEPLGFLTHHLVHTEDIWQFSRALLSTLLDHGATPANLRQLP
jgi:hypothetical protein